MSEAIEDAGLEPEAEAAPIVATPEDAPQEQSADDRALTMGWVPKEQFRGPAEKWVDAETFIKRGEEFLPFLKANNKRLEQAQERHTKEIERLKGTLEKFAEHHSKAEQRAYERALWELQSEQAAAVEANDLGRVQAITQEIVGLNAEAKGSKVEPEQGDPPVLADWKADNAWYSRDPVMRAAAVAIADQLVSEGVIDPARQLAEVTKRIKAEFPQKFENPNRRAAPAVEGGGQAARRTGRTWGDLPREAQIMADEFVRDIPGFTREKYVKGYDWEQTK